MAVDYGGAETVGDDGLVFVPELWCVSVVQRNCKLLTVARDLYVL